MDVRKALRRFAGFFEGKWETINGRPPSPGGYAVSPFLKMGDAFFRETRDGRYVVALDIYPQLLVRTLDFLGCSPSTESINNAILKWDAVELEEAAAAEGLVLAMVRTNEEFRREPQYTDVLSKMPLITVEKIGESDPVPLKASGNLPLAGIRAFGNGSRDRGSRDGKRHGTIRRGRAQHLETARFGDRSLRVGCPGGNAFNHTRRCEGGSRTIQSASPGC